MNVFIPTCGESPYLLPLLESLVPHADVVHVHINNVGDELFAWLRGGCQERGAEVSYTRHDTLHSMWNGAMRWGRDVSNKLAILNDDIEMDGKCLPQMERALGQGWAMLGFDYVHMDMCELLRVNAVRGTYRKNGISGAAFAVDPRLVEPVDEGFRWWGGDDDLVYTTLRNGHRVGLAVGLGYVHHASTSASQHPEIQQYVEQDRQYMLAKWGESW